MDSRWGAGMVYAAGGGRCARSHGSTGSPRAGNIRPLILSLSKDMSGLEKAYPCTRASVSVSSAEMKRTQAIARGYSMRVGPMALMVPTPPPARP